MFVLIVVGFDMERYPECHNLKCGWNMGDAHGSYKYLDCSCYHNSDTVPFQSCTKRIIKKPKEVEKDKEDQAEDAESSEPTVEEPF